LGHGRAILGERGQGSAYVFVGLWVPWQEIWLRQAKLSAVGGRQKIISAGPLHIRGHGGDHGVATRGWRSLWFVARRPHGRSRLSSLLRKVPRHGFGSLCHIRDTVVVGQLLRGWLMCYCSLRDIPGGFQWDGRRTSCGRTPPRAGLHLADGRRVLHLRIASRVAVPTGRSGEWGLRRGREGGHLWYQSHIGCTSGE